MAADAALATLTAGGQQSKDAEQAHANQGAVCTADTLQVVHMNTIESVMIQVDRCASGPVPPGAVAVAAESMICRGPEDGEPPEEAFSGITLPVKSALDLKQERLIGSVTKYLPVSGYGMVKSHMFEGELMFRIDRIMPEFQAHPLHENEGVEFDVQADENGKAVAVAVKPVLGRKPYDVLGQRHRGYVRRFAERWGFLNAAAFDGDLFVHRDNLLLEPGSETGADGQPILRTGQVVEFDVALDDRGRAVAKQITTRALLRPGDWIGHRLRGYIRSFQGAWGFINSDRFAGDLFVHRDSLLAQCQNAQLGLSTVVEFDIERDHHRKGAKNRLVARNVAVLGPPEAAPHPVPAPTPAPALPGPGQAPPTDPAPLPGLPHPHPSPAPQPAPMYYQAPPPPVPDPSSAYGLPPYPYQHPYPYPPSQTTPYPLPYTPPAGGAHYPYGHPPSFGQPLPYHHSYPSTPHPGTPTHTSPASATQSSATQPAATLAAATQPAAVQPAAVQPAALPNGTPPNTTQPNVTPTKSKLPAQVAATQPTATQSAAAHAETAQLAATQPEALQASPTVPQPAEEHRDVTAQQAKSRFRAPSESGTGSEVAGESTSPKVNGQTSAAPAAQNGVPAKESQSQGLLHITVHDWEPDQPGQLCIEKGSLVNISYRAAHGWVYAGTVRTAPEGDKLEKGPDEGWIPQAVVKRVTMCRVAVDWPAEGEATLGVTKGEILAVSKEAERGWVYGELISADTCGRCTRPDNKPSDGWLPKKVLDYLQSYL
ncbi:unnamed protein product [Symbiodinium sp. CCMP2456]|nr:unnamed protein product [Symbiodinium sp. CCMP2456]